MATDPDLQILQVEPLPIGKIFDIPMLLVRRWRTQAKQSREEAGRIRRTIKEPTDAEERCNVRAEVWDNCADELESILGGQS